MVKESIYKGKRYFQCNICKLYYKEKSWALKCEDWCSKNPSCNINVIKHSINI